MFQNLLPNGITPHDVKLYLNFRSDDCTDRFKKTAYTPTAVTFAAEKNNSRSATFNGTTSKIDCGSEIIGTGNITVIVFLNASGLGENSFGRIMDNGKFLFYCRNTTPANCFISVSDGLTVTDANSAENSFATSAEMCIALTRTSAGVTNFYKNGVLSGDADQDGHTPEAGSTNLIIGNNNAGDRTWDGVLRSIQIYNKILTVQQIGQVYNRFRYS